MHKRVAIITLCYDGLEFTVQYIKSLYACTDINLFDLYIVNNHSSDGTQEYLDYLQTVYNNIRILKSNINLGFSEGNNIAFKQIFDGDLKYDFILEANNDIIVHKGWLESMLKCADSNDSIALVGPVSNYVMDHQVVRINTTIFNPTIDDIDRFANYHKEQSITKKVPCYTKEGVLSGFCLLIRYNVLKSFGFYPSDLVTFDDNLIATYCLYNGYQLYCDRHNFIFHYGSKTFKNKNQDMRKIMKENHIRYIKEANKRLNNNG